MSLLLLGKKYKRVIVMKSQAGDGSLDELEGAPYIDVEFQEIKRNLPSWNDVSSRNDVGPLDNFPRNNSLGLSLVSDTGRKIIYDDNEIVKNNVGSKTSSYIKKLCEKRSYIDGKKFFTVTDHKLNFRVNKSSDNLFRKSQNHVNKFFQVQRRKFFLGKNVEIKFKQSSQLFDFGTDYMIKKVSEGSDVSKVWINSEAFKLNRKFNFSGTFVSNFIPLANKIETQKFCSVLPLYLIKKIINTNKLSEKFINKRKILRSINDCSIINDIKLNIFDAGSIKSNDWYSETRNSDGIEKINIYVTEGQEKDFAVLIHTLALYRLPINIGSIDNRESMPSNSFNFKDSIKLKEINIITKDVIKLQTYINDVTTEDIINNDNLSNVLELYKNLIPCKYSMEMSDSFLFIEYTIGQLHNKDQFKDKFTMPITVLPSDIGVFEIIEPGYYGLSEEVVQLELIENNIQKFNNSLEALNTYLVITIKETVNLEKNKDKSLNYITQEIESSVNNNLSGQLMSDKIWSGFYESVRITPYFTFIPGYFKSLRRLIYPNLSNLIKEGEINLSFPTNYLSLSQQVVYKEHQFPLILSGSWGFSKIEINESLIKAEGPDIDIIENILYKGNSISSQPVDFSGVTNSYKLNNEDNEYYLDDRTSSVVQYDLNKRNFKIELVDVKNPYTPDYSIEDSVTTISQEDTIILKSKVTFNNQPTIKSYTGVSGNPIKRLLELIAQTRGLTTTNKQQIISYFNSIIHVFRGKEFIFTKENKDNSIIVYHFGLDDEVMDEIIDTCFKLGLKIVFIYNDPPAGFDPDSPSLGGTDPDEEGPDGGDDSGFGLESYEEYDKAQYFKGNVDKNLNFKSNSVKILSKELLEVMLEIKRSNNSFLEYTSGKNCFKETVIQIIESENVKISIGKRTELLEELNKYIENKTPLTDLLFYDLFSKYKIPLMVLVCNDYNLNDTQTYLTVLNKIPREVVFICKKSRHIGKVNKKAYVELNAKLFKNKDELSGDDYRWYRVLSTMCRSGKSLNASYKIVKEQEIMSQYIMRG